MSGSESGNPDEADRMNTLLPEFQETVGCQHDSAPGNYHQPEYETLVQLGGQIRKSIYLPQGENPFLPLPANLYQGNNQNVFQLNTHLESSVSHEPLSPQLNFEPLPLWNNSQPQTSTTAFEINFENGFLNQTSQNQQASESLFAGAMQNYILGVQPPAHQQFDSTLVPQSLPIIGPNESDLFSNLSTLMALNASQQNDHLSMAQLPLNPSALNIYQPTLDTVPNFNPMPYQPVQTVQHHLQLNNMLPETLRIDATSIMTNEDFTSLLLFYNQLMQQSQSDSSRPGVSAEPGQEHQRAI